jgi:SAM-dependent methyltransferase
MGADAVEFVRHGAEYVGIDLSAESVALARKRFEVFDLQGRFLVMDGANSAAMAELGHFDLVYSCGVLHHYPDLPRVLNNIRAALNTGGDLRFLVYAKNSWKYAMIQAGLDQFEAQAGCPYAQAYTRDDIHHLLRDFDIQSIRQAHCFMYNVPLYKQGIYELEPWFAAMSEEMREAVRQHLGWHLLVHARKHETY